MAGVTRIPKLGTKPLLDPGELLKYANQTGTPLDFYGRANSYRCPRGKEPGTAYVLMLKSDLDLLDKNAFHDLVWTDSVGPTTLTIKSLCIVRANCMNLALPADGQAAYLVELQDVRRVLQRSNIAEQYNVPIPAPPNCGEDTVPEVLYYPESLNSTTGLMWTWQTMLSDIFAKLPAAGQVNPAVPPVLPWTPTSTPTDLRFYGMSAWDALHVALSAIGCTTAYNPTTGLIEYVRLSSTQTGLAASLTALEGVRLYEYNPATGCNLADVPATITVWFHRNEEHFGIEKDTPRNNNWEMAGAVPIEVPTNAVGAVGNLPVWADMPAWVDKDETVTNEADINARALELVNELVGKMTVGDERSGANFGGIIDTITPGPEVREVCWRDYGDDDGTITEIRNGPDVPPIGQRWNPAQDTLEAADYGRKTHPVYPKESQIVQVETGETSGCSAATNACGLHPGRVYRMTRSGMDPLEPCWIKFLDSCELTGGTPAADNQKYIGRLYGTYDCEGCQWPLYVVEPRVNMRVRVRVFDEIKCGETGAATILEHDPASPAGECNEIETTCTIEVCNRSNRTIKCVDPSFDNGIPYENGTAWLTNDCIWIIEPDARAMEATVTISAAMCSTDESGEEIEADVVPGSELYRDVCEWTETIEKVKNAYGRQACAGKDVHIQWDAAACGWYVTQVTPLEDKVVSEAYGCSATCDGGRVKQYNTAVVETCDCTPTESELMATREITLLQGLGLSGSNDPGEEHCSMVGQAVTFCTIACGTPTNSTPKMFDFVPYNGMTGLSEGSDALNCEKQIAYVPCIGGTSSDPCIPLEPCPPPQDPIVDI